MGFGKTFQIKYFLILARIDFIKKMFYDLSS